MWDLIQSPQTTQSDVSIPRFTEGKTEALQLARGHVVMELCPGPSRDPASWQWREAYSEPIQTLRTAGLISMNDCVCEQGCQQPAKGFPSPGAPGGKTNRRDQPLLARPSRPPHCSPLPSPTCFPTTLPPSPEVYQKGDFFERLRHVSFPLSSMQSLS